MTSVRDIKGIGEKTERLLAKLEIRTVEDLVHHYPRCYMTYPDPIPAADLQPGVRASLCCQIISPIQVKAIRQLTIVSCQAADPTGRVFLSWFNMPYLKKTLKQKTSYIITGTPALRDGRLVLEQAAVNLPDRYRTLTETFQPVYPLTAGLSLTVMRKAMASALAMREEKQQEDYLPAVVRDYYNLMEEDRALREIHFPTGTQSLKEARRRIIFDEFFRFFCAMEIVRDRENQALNHYIIPMGEGVSVFLASLPFPLTSAQQRVLSDIRHDLSGTMAMNRLIQGDVGSGKTVVAMTAMLAAVKAGYQAACMVPTEVLALQHFDSFGRMLSDQGVRIGLLTSSVKGAERRRLLKSIREGETQLVIGTHALIQKGVVFKDLALVVTDEQHRFGVRQRDALSEKGLDPHVLVMSATPIPRTLGIILYRDLDVSIMDELPASRKPIKNCVIQQQDRPKAWSFLQKEVAAGHQAYVICPAIEENEGLDVENVSSYVSLLAAAMPSSVCVAGLNGKMSPKDKAAVMDRFARNEIQILVSTTVIEVGIDVPNATAILIENAERFGLAQLHQLRGRTGRGPDQSYCIFISGTDREEALARLAIVGRSNDGFYIAGQDLKLRGPGDFFGTKQSGTMEFALGDVYANADILQDAAQAVDHLRESGYEIRDYYQYSLEKDLDLARNL